MGLLTIIFCIWLVVLAEAYDIDGCCEKEDYYECLQSCLCVWNNNTKCISYFPDYNNTIVNNISFVYNKSNICDDQRDRYVSFLLVSDVIMLVLVAFCIIFIICFSIYYVMNNIITIKDNYNICCDRYGCIWCPRT